MSAPYGPGRCLVCSLLVQQADGPFGLIWLHERTPSTAHAARPDEEAELDATMRAQMATNPEAGGPRDPAIGPHPRFREMDARRERFLAMSPEEQAAHVMLRQLLGPKR